MSPPEPRGELQGEKGAAAEAEDRQEGGREQGRREDDMEGSVLDESWDEIKII